MKLASEVVLALLSGLVVASFVLIAARMIITALGH